MRAVGFVRVGIIGSVFFSAAGLPVSCTAEAGNDCGGSEGVTQQTGTDWSRTKKGATLLRQKLLILYSHTPDLKSDVGAWTLYDATGEEHHTTGDSDTPPYHSVFAAMKDGWRVLQFPQQFPPYPGMELSTSYLPFEYILEKWEEAKTNG